MPPNDPYLLSQHVKRMETKKINEDYKENCWSCRLTSGFGLIAAAGYIVYHIDKAKGRYVKAFLLVSSSGLVSLGAARLFDFPPFGPPRSALEPTQEKQILVKNDVTDGEED